MHGHPRSETASIQSPLSLFPNKACLGAGFMKAFWSVSREVASLVLTLGFSLQVLNSGSNMRYRPFVEGHVSLGHVATGCCTISLLALL